jgi:hypothetical protein
VKAYRQFKGAVDIMVSMGQFKEGPSTVWINGAAVPDIIVVATTLEKTQGLTVTVKLTDLAGIAG